MSAGCIKSGMQILKRLYPEGDPHFGWRIGEKMAWASDHLARSNTFRNQTAILRRLEKERRELLSSPPDGLDALEMQAWHKRVAGKKQDLEQTQARIKRENAGHDKARDKFNASLLRPKSQSTPIPNPIIINGAAPKYTQWTQEDFSLLRRLLPDWIGKIL